MKGRIVIIPIEEREYEALRKVLPADAFMSMHCHYSKHYLVEGKRNLEALAEYRNNVVSYKNYEINSKKK